MKHQLLNEVFAIDGNYRPAENKAAESKLLEYIEKNGDDPQINDALRILEIYAVEGSLNDFEESRKIATPILNRLTRAYKWNFYDIRILARVIDYVEPYERTHALAKEALRQLEEYSKEERYTIIKLSIHVNIMVRLLRARYFDLEDMDDPEALENLDSVFSMHFDAVIDICENGNFPIHRAIAIIRKGIFTKDHELMEEGFKVLKKLKEYDLHRMLEDEAKEYERYSGFDISKRRFNVMVGRNVREQRKACGLSIDDVAKMLDMTIAAVGLMERGDRGQTSYNLARLADIFGVSVDVLYNDTGDGPSNISADRRKNAKAHKLDVIIENFTEAEMKFLVATAEGIHKLKNS